MDLCAAKQEEGSNTKITKITKKKGKEKPFKNFKFFFLVIFVFLVLNPFFFDSTAPEFRWALGDKGFNSFAVVGGGVRDGLHCA